MRIYRKKKRDLAQVTVPDLTYESMKKQTKAIYDQYSASEYKKVASSGDEIQIESEMYHGQDRGPWRRGPFRGNNRSRGVNFRNCNIGGSFSSNRAGRFVPRKDNRNPLGRDGRPTQCHSFSSIYRWFPQCPSSSENKRSVSKEVHISYLTEQVEQCFLEQEFLFKALNLIVRSLTVGVILMLLASTGCTAIMMHFQVTLIYKRDVKTFRFGSSKSYPSLKQVTILANIDDIELEIAVDVVDFEIPLFLSNNL